MSLFFLFLQLAGALEIVDWSLPNEEDRQKLTQLYLQEHYTGELVGSLEEDVWMEPKVVGKDLD